MIEPTLSPSAHTDDLRAKISPLRLSLQNAANEIADPVYLFIDPTREQAAALGRLTLQMATAAPGESFSATLESSLSIYFPRDLLALNDVRAIQLQPASAEGWTLELPTEEDAPLILKPKRAFTISKDQPQTIAFSQVLATSGEPIKLRSITFAWENFTGLTDDLRICNATRERPPAAADEKANLEVKWAPRTEYYEVADTVYVTPYTITPTAPGIGNRLILRIGNKEEGQLENNHAEFTVSFPTTKSGDARSALCTPEQLIDVKWTQLTPFQHKWQMEVVTDNEVRHWILRPPAGSPTVFGQDAYVSFEFRDLVTEMMVAPCAAVVSWSGIKGHKSGALRVTAEKTPPRPAVIAFNARAGSREVFHSDALDFKENITFDWRLFAADACRLDESEDGALHSQLTLNPGDTKVVFPTKPGTVYTLTPQITLGGSVRRGAPVDKQFRINPATAKLWANPDQLIPPQPPDNPETYPTKTTLRWECTSGDCFLSGPGLARHEVRRVGNTEVTAGVSQYRIECNGTTNVSAIAQVRLPAPFVKFKVEPCPGKVFRLSWRSTYVTDIEVRTPSNRSTDDVSRDLTGTVDVNGARADIVANGAGKLTVRITLGNDATDFPDVTAIAYHRSDGSRFFLAYKNADNFIVNMGSSPVKSSDLFMSGWFETGLNGNRPTAIVELVNKIFYPSQTHQKVVMTVELNK